MEEENELEVLGNLLKLWTNRRDRDELGDVEEEGQDNDRENMDEDGQLGAMRGNSDQNESINICKTEPDCTW